MCRYNGCSETARGDSAWCILHLDFPNEDDPEFTRIQDEKQLKTKEKIQGGDLNFEGTNIYGVDASELSIPAQNNVIFKNATIKGRVKFERTKIEQDASFEGAKIEKNASFAGAEIGGKLGLKGRRSEETPRSPGWRSGERLGSNELRLEDMPRSPGRR